MKILEITEPQIEPASDPHGLAVAKMGQKNRELGRGVYAAVFLNPGDMQTVKKIASVAQNKWERDGYYAYIMEIGKQNKEHPNPYLPQIIGVKRFSNDEGDYMEVEIEKLYPVTREYTDVVGALEKLYQTRFEEEDFDLLGISPYSLLTITTRDYFFDSSIRIKTLPTTGEVLELSPDFKEAVEVVRKAKKQFMSLDIHLGNLMIRRTPYGPQLVITDPLSS